MNNIKSISLIITILLAITTNSYNLGKRTTNEAATTTPISIQTTANAEHKILYYHNPMNLPDTSPIPKKNTININYVPIYKNKKPHDNDTVNINPTKIQKLNIKNKATTLHHLNKTLRTTNMITMDEKHIHTITPKLS